MAVLLRPGRDLTLLLYLVASFLGLLAVFAALSTSAAALSVLVDPACFYKGYLVQGFVPRYLHFNKLASRFFWPEFRSIVLLFIGTFSCVDYQLGGLIIFSSSSRFLCCAVYILDML